MSWKTTLILAIVVAAGAGAWYLLDLRQTSTPDSPTLSFLEQNLKPEKLTRITVERGKRRVELTRKAGEEWALPGGWPIRDAELKQFLTMLTTLRSRHTPVAISADQALEAYGLTGDPLRIVIKVDDKEYTLTFGEEPASNNRFTRATWLRLDSVNEVVRFGPGVIAGLDRTQEFFQKPRLFAYRAVPEKKD